MKDDAGLFHCFYIMNNISVTAVLNESQLGHATSPDLYHWTVRAPVLHSDSSSWNNGHVWAPTIVRKDSLWWMLYAGTTRIDGQYNDTQRIGLAVSADLDTWNRVETPVYAATQVPWTWVDSLNSVPAFRDPFVMRDPSTPGSWLMYYTASYEPDSLADVVGVARSSGDFTQWTDVGPLLETWRGYSYNALTESPHLFFHGGLWYLVITTSSGQPLSLYTSPDPLAPPAGWSYRGRLRNMLGEDTSNWIASECFRDGTHDLFAWVAADRLEFREIEWTQGWAFSLLPPPYFHVQSMHWTADTTVTAGTAQLVLNSTTWAAGPPLLRTFVLDSLGAEIAVPAESLGFAAAPWLHSDSDTLRWIARRWPAVPDSDTTTVTRFVVRTSDSTAVSNVLAVRAILPSDTLRAPPEVQPPDPYEPGPEPILIPILRTWERSPAGEAPTAMVRMPAAAPGRLDLYDVTGRRVRTLVAGTLPKGVSVYPWDGRGDDGRMQPHGVYFVRLATGPHVRTGRFVLLAR